MSYGDYYNSTSEIHGYVGGAVTISGSTISGNTASSNYASAYGGGLKGTNDITIVNSVLSSNLVTTASTGANIAAGGAVSGGEYTYNLAITGSTLSGNAATATGQGYAGGAGATTEFLNYGTAFVVTNSTISGNSVSSSNSSGDYSYGAGIVQSPAQGKASLKIYNSTIAFNTAGEAAGGIATIYNAGVGLYSTIVANNTAKNYIATSDIGSNGGALTVAGDYNLVQTDPSIYGVTLSGTHNIVGSDPQLQPLANNGGTTPTHALAPTSPAIDAGNNPLALPFDQRGDPYARVVGNAADIGAFELNTDQIFGSGFE